MNIAEFWVSLISEFSVKAKKYSTKNMYIIYSTYTGVNNTRKVHLQERFVLVIIAIKYPPTHTANVITSIDLKCYHITDNPFYFESAKGKENKKVAIKQALWGLLFSHKLLSMYEKRIVTY